MPLTRGAPSVLATRGAASSLSQSLNWLFRATRRSVTRPAAATATWTRNFTLLSRGASRPADDRDKLEKEGAQICLPAPPLPRQLCWRRRASGKTSGPPGAWRAGRGDLLAGGLFLPPASTQHRRTGARTTRVARHWNGLAASSQLQTYRTKSANSAVRASSGAPEASGGAD